MYLILGANVLKVLLDLLFALRPCRAHTVHHTSDSSGLKC